MRALAVVVALASASAVSRSAGAERVYEPPAPRKPAHDFWRQAIEPHGPEIDILLGRARNALDLVNQSRNVELDATSLANRVKVLDELVGLLVYAHHLSPGNLDVLEQLGPIADEAGQPRLALDALHQLFRARPQAQTAARLAAIYLRRGELDDAVYWSRTALASTFGGGFDRGDQPAQVLLASALELRGDTGSAIDTLANAAPFERQALIAQLALAVAYDRDEQRGAELDVLARIKSSVGESYAEEVEDAIGRFRFAPAEDVHYFRALFAESIEAYTEARAEWLVYASSGGAFRARALTHVADLDTMRRTQKHQPETPVPLQNHVIKLKAIP